MSEKRLTPLGSAVAGAFGACFANAIVYPLDPVKTRLQALDSSAYSITEKDVTVPPPSARPQRRRSLVGQVQQLPIALLKRLKRWQMLTMLIRIVKTEGISGLFNGFTATMINTFSMRGLGQIFTIPVAVVATRQQLWQPPTSASTTRQKQAPSLWDTATQIIGEGGITALWTGLKPGLVLTVNPAITYGVFERLKTGVLARREGGIGNGKLSVGEAFWLGVCSKTLATVVTYPYIFAKVRLQARSASPSASALVPNDPSKAEPSYAEVASTTPSSDAPVVAESTPSAGTGPSEHSIKNKVTKENSLGAIGILKQVYQEHGVLGWYQGLGAQIAKAVLCQGILFVSKDQFESYTWSILSLLSELRSKYTA